ncbi:MAG: hypothetical protein K940chlam3_01335, partial [Chlamydiae bacterium]|nr:hypothetical protein [Chlamydiota bacterium]
MKSKPSRSSLNKFRILVALKFNREDARRNRPTSIIFFQNLLRKEVPSEPYLFDYQLHENRFL